MTYSYTPPTNFRSGETVQWKMTDSSDYPQASGYEAKATISGRNSKVTIAAIFTGGEWLFLLKASSNILSAGEYVVYIFFTKGAGETLETIPVSENDLTVKTGLSTAVTTDLRTHEQKMIALIEKTLEIFAEDTAIQSQQVGDKMYQRTDIEKLYALRNKYMRKQKGVAYQTVPVTF